MGIGVSIFLIALGAILTFALEAKVSGIDLDTVGIILMIVGALGLVLTMLIWGRRDTAGRTDVVDRTVVRDREIL